MDIASSSSNRCMEAKTRKLTQVRTLNGLRLKGLDEECLLVLVRIRNYRGLYLGYDSDDRSLFRYAVANVAAEICSRSVCAEVVDMGGAAT